MSSATALWLDYALRMSAKRRYSWQKIRISATLTIMCVGLLCALSVDWTDRIFPLRLQCLIADFFYRSRVHAAKNHVVLKHRASGRSKVGVV